MESGSTLCPITYQEAINTLCRGERRERLTITCDDRELPPTTPIAGAERWIRTKVVMNGADAWDMTVRYETSFLLHVCCGFAPDASSAPSVCGTSGMEGISSW